MWSFSLRARMRNADKASMTMATRDATMDRQKNAEDSALQQQHKACRQASTCGGVKLVCRGADKFTAVATGGNASKDSGGRHHGARLGTSRCCRISACMRAACGCSPADRNPVHHAQLRAQRRCGASLKLMSSILRSGPNFAAFSTCIRHGPLH